MRHTIATPQPSSCALTTGFHVSHPRRAQSSRTRLHRWKCVLGMPHTGDVALVQVVCPLVHIYQALAKFKPFPCLLFYGCGSHRSAPLPVSDLTLALHFPEHLNLAGSFTSARLCSRCSRYKQHPLPLTIHHPKHSSLWLIPSFAGIILPHSGTCL